MGVYVAICCALGGLGSVSWWNMWGAHLGDRIGARPGWNIISPCGSTLGGGAGDAPGVFSGVFTLRGGVTCGESAMLNI